MRLGTENRKQTILASVLGVAALGACIYFYEEVFATDTPAPAPVVVQPVRPVGVPVASLASTPVGAGGSKHQAAANSAAALDPTLHMDAMRITEAVEYQGIGRNIFSMASAPPPPSPIPIPIGHARNDTPPPPPVAPPPPPTCPPQCPPIPLKYFGTLTMANGTRQAFLLHGEDVFPALAGDIVMRRYKVVSISATSIQMEDMPNGNTQMLPLMAN